MAHIAKDFGPDPRLRKLLANMVYVGVVAEMLGLDEQVLEQAVNDQFHGKEKVVKLNLDVVRAGIQYAREHFDKASCPFRVAAAPADAGQDPDRGQHGGGDGRAHGRRHVLRVVSDHAQLEPVRDLH